MFQEQPKMHTSFYLRYRESSPPGFGNVDAIIDVRSVFWSVTEGI